MSNENIMTLCKVKIGKKVRVVKVTNDADTAGRLISLGVLPGDELEVTGKALFGSPLAVKRGQVFFAIRKDEAKHILVEEIKR